MNMHIDFTEVAFEATIAVLIYVAITKSHSSLKQISIIGDGAENYFSPHAIIDCRYRDSIIYELIYECDLLQDLRKAVDCVSNRTLTQATFRSEDLTREIFIVTFENYHDFLISIRVGKYNDKYYFLGYV